jgi:hypothetical protein
MNKIRIDKGFYKNEMSDYEQILDQLTQKILMSKSRKN